MILMTAIWLMKRRLVYYVLGLLLGACAAMVIAAGVWVHHSLRVPSTPTPIDFKVSLGNGPRTIAQSLNAAGIPLWETGFVWMARVSGEAKNIKAGSYQLLQGDTPWRVLKRLVHGDMLQQQITFVEGWTFKQIREALRQDTNIKQTLSNTDDAELLRRLGAHAPSMEGLIAPNTYVFFPGSSDFDLLRRAYEEGQRILMQAWAQRQADLPIHTPYEALILASIIEKETGDVADRARVAGVFINRLREGMLLQTDPAVIYGRGDTYKDRLTRADLQADTPWNTYTRLGLPPTPIASCGQAALLATVQPERHNYLYFVSRGNGRSEFSRTLSTHNRNVSRYILGREQTP
jgi:UPF0755 protein